MFIRFTKTFNILFKGSEKETLTFALNRLLKESRTSVDAIASIEKTIEQMKISDLSHFQKLGIVRFNPFADTGGSQSFTMAFLDGKNTGIVLTSLYARTGNRWYIKQVISGRGDEIALSKEEQLAVNSAQSIEHQEVRKDK